MSPAQPLRVLVDNSIESLSNTMQCVRKPVKTLISGTPQIFQVVAFERRPPAKASEVWKNAQLECLPTVARLAGEGRLEFFTYSELRNEAWKRPGSFSAYPLGKLFAKVVYQELEPPVERSRYFQLPMQEYVTKACMIQFCKWLLSVDVDELIKVVSGLCSPFEIENLRNIYRYRSLCRGLGDGQLPDAFHLWTAEVHGLSCFLTADGRFIRAITAPSHRHLPCPPMSPQELLKSLNVTELEAFPFRHGETVGMFGQPV